MNKCKHENWKRLGTTDIPDGCLDCGMTLREMLEDMTKTINLLENKLSLSVSYNELCKEKILELKEQIKK